MATAVQRRRGTSVEHLTFTGYEGELTIDTDKETGVVHDGATAGGFALLREDMANYDGSTIDNFRSKGIDDNSVGSLSVWTIHDTGSKLGSPTGGDINNLMGPGTVNTEGVFVNGGTILTETSNANITADWQFSGNVSFTGDVTNASSTNTNVKDNLMILNDEEIANGVAGGTGTSGLQIDRGFTSSAVATTGDLTFTNNNPDEIVRATGDWTTDGVIAGSYVSIAGSTQNDGVYLVASVSTTSTANDTIVLDGTENLIADGPEAVTTVTVLNSPNTKASLIFDETTDTWKAGLLGSEVTIATGGTLVVGDTGIVVTDTGTDGTIVMSTDGTPALTISNDQSSTFAGTGAFVSSVDIDDASVARLRLHSTGTGSDWQLSSFSDGKLYFGINGVADYVTLSSTSLNVTGAIYQPIGVNNSIGMTATTAHDAGNVGYVSLSVNDGNGAAGVFIENTHGGVYSSQEFVVKTAKGGVVGSTERFRIDSLGVATLAKDLTLTDGILTINEDTANEPRMIYSNDTTGILGDTRFNNTGTYIIRTGGVSAVGLTVDNLQNVILGSGELADSATNGFFYLPSTTSGLPTGTPTTHAGRNPFVYDDTNDNLYVFNGTWKTIGATDPSAGLAYAIAFS